VSVAETLILPNQPTSGIVSRISLGGDGFSSPMAAYTVANFQLTGDGTGGQVTFTVQLDDRFCALVAYASIGASQPTATNISVRFRLDSAPTGQGFAPQVYQPSVVANSLNLNAQTIRAQWTPHAVITPGSDVINLSCAIINVDLVVHNFSAMIYLFNINARQRVPIEYLLRAVGQASLNDQAS